MARLNAAGLPVPDTLVVPASALRSCIDRAGLDLGRDPAVVAEDLRSLPLPEEWAAALRRGARSLGARIAVRSSATDEDDAMASAAGQYRTELGVEPSGVVDAIRRVWASLYEAPAVAYRGGTRAGMAVLLQTQITPRCSGVLFTVNPMNGSWREMVVEATWGMGEGLVGGQIAPHWYLVRRPHRIPGRLQRLISRLRLSVMQEDLPDLPEVWMPDGQGHVRRMATPIDLRSRRTLSRAALLRLCRLGLRVERHLGSPQDLEWCADERGRFTLLQSRPITRTGTPRDRSDVVWTRRFIGERWPEPVTPMGWSILEPIFSFFIAYPSVQARYLGGGEAMRLVGGRPYLNTTVFRHLAFKLPGAPPLRFMAELLPPGEEEAWRRHRAVAPDLGVYAALLRTTLGERRWSRFAFNPLSNPEAWDQWRDALRDALSRWQERPDGAADAMQRAARQIEWIRGYTGIHLCSLLFANLFYQLLDGALAAWLPARRAALMEALAICPSGNRTLMANTALWQLAQLATEAELDRLHATGTADGRTRFGKRLRAFLDDYGQRSDASWEICTRRWEDDPAALVPLLRVHRAAEVEDPSARAEVLEVQHRQALAEASAALSPGRRALLRVLVRYTRRYLLLRENQRFWFEHLLRATQRSLRVAGDELAAEDVIAHGADVAFLTWTEVQGLVGRTLASEGAREWVSRRRERWEQESRSPEPPVFLVGGDPMATIPVGRRLQGMAISPGRVRGRVRVLRTLREGQALQTGEVLVTRAVDPGWTPLFLSASAVVLELGGLLSHGAVIAREYGVPMVVNIDSATQRLEDGVEVTVDGTRGVVWVHG